jgi:glycolate oxidase FAD binding subunit
VLEELAGRIRSHGTAGQAVRPVGGGTKLAWGGSAGDAVDLETGGLDQILEHNVGDFTAVLQAGVRLVDAQAAFAAEGQMLALDPPLGAGDGATVGGMIATADSGPMRHRYGGVRDLVVGMTVVLSDGTIAKSGGKVIKNVAGYDLAKLFAGSYGTLGLIGQVSVRLHPLPGEHATASGASDDPQRLHEAAAELARHPSRPTASTSPGRAAPAACWSASAGPRRRTRRRRSSSACARSASRSPRRPATTSRPGPPCAACSGRPTASWSRSPGARPTCRR